MSDRRTKNKDFVLKIAIWLVLLALTAFLTFFVDKSIIIGFLAGIYYGDKLGLLE